uniref:Uncharacterized protein n=1 Tax=Avena sativa TaxID=4498 RepID=A0ACD6AFA5_AVESA
MPQPPELASVVRRASFDLDTTTGRGTLGVCYCWNGLLLVTSEWRAIYTRRVLCPLYSARYLATLPSLPETGIHDGFTYRRCEILPNGRGGDGMPYFYFAIGWCNKEEQSVLDVYVLQDDIWAIYASVTTEIPRIDLLLPNSLIVGDKIYNMACVGGSNRLVSLDLASSCLSLVNLPEEVEFKRTELSLKNDYSEVHLNHVKGSQLRIWLHMVDNDDGLANWLLVNTICLHEICADYMIPTGVLEDVGDSKLLVYAAGVDSGLFFMEKDEVLYLFDIKRKTAKKVFEAT